MLKISIITVSYNSAATLAQTIQSVRAQRYPFVEYIVVDGGSTDNTAAILEQYRDQIDHLICEPDEGIYDAMNKGIKRASGDVIGLLNADDLYSHDQVLDAVAEAFIAPDVDACYSDLIYFASDKPDHVVRYWRSCDFQPGLFAKGWNPPHPTFFVRKQVYAQYGDFNTRYAMGNDIELMMRLLEKYHIKTLYIPHTWVKMRLGGVSNQKISHIVRQNLNILSAAKHLGVKMSFWQFFIYKTIDRISQFVRSPRSALSHEQ